MVNLKKPKQKIEINFMINNPSKILVTSTNKVTLDHLIKKYIEP